MPHPQPSPSPAVALTDLSFRWPDGAPVLDGVSGTFATGRTGLIGDNGSGKSTLLRLIASELTPASGSVTRTGAVGYLPQTLTLRTADTVADLLGVRATLDGLRAIEGGSVEQSDFDAVGDDWDVEARAAAVLTGLRLGHLELDRPVRSLSGGESVLTALAGLRLAAAEITLLDEPTNNLDRSARARLRDQVATWPSGRSLIVVSHDRELLEQTDQTVELRDTTLTSVDGPYSAFAAHIEAEQEAAAQAVRTAEQQVRNEKRQRREAETRLARRARQGRTAHANKRAPRIAMNQWRTNAQVSAAKLRANLDDRVDSAHSNLGAARSRVRAGASITVDLPDPDVAAGRRLLSFEAGEVIEAAEADRATDRVDSPRPVGPIVLQGPERAALLGANGVGKTLLVESIVGLERPDHAPRPAALAYPHTSRIGYLPQRLAHLEDELSAVETVRQAAPSATPQQVRAQLAAFLIRAESADRAVGTLSGGQRFRVALARVLLADPAPQLLVLDEPTNSLDLSSVDELVSALTAFRGGLLVVSHDQNFLARLGIDTWLELTHESLHRVSDPNAGELSPGTPVR